MRRWATGLAMILTGWAVSLAGGCGQPPLTRDQQVDALLKENRRLEDLLIAAEQKVSRLTPPGEKPTVTPAPKIEDPFVAVSVQFGKYSDIVGLGGKPADERLKVVVEPLDGEGDAVKRAGALDLEAFETGAAAPKLYAVWKFTPQEMAKAWLSGLGTYAYVLKLPWPDGKPPQGDKLLLKMKFTTLEGDALTAETTLAIKRPAPPAGEPPAKPARPAKAPAKGEKPVAAPLGPAGQAE